MIQTEEEEKKNTSNSIPYWSEFISTYSNLSPPQRFGSTSSIFIIYVQLKKRKIYKIIVK
jgi:hypothetical protein